jgi:hypothetical protein
MQEQSNDSPEEHIRSRESAEQAGEVFSFQEIAYPSPLKRWFQSFKTITENRGLQYFIGIVIGAIPLAAAMLTLGNFSIGIAASVLVPIATFGYLTILIASIVCLCISQVRFIGYGLLTMVLISPIIYFISCSAVIRSCGYRRINC